MARLLVLRGDSLEQEIQLTGRTVRIGRGQHSDLVLEDPGKSVSRDHAEIRFENDRYVLVDLDSQNGVWVAGGRVPYVVFDADVVASLGPFRLMLDPAGDVEAGAPPVEAQSRLRANDEDYSLSGNSGLNAPGGASAQPTPANWFARQSKWVLGGAAALTVAAIAFGATRLIGRQGQNDTASAKLERAAALIEAGDCAKALEEIEPVLAADPDDATAQELKAQAEGCTGPVAPEARPEGKSPDQALTTDQINAHLTAARELIDRRNCAVALGEHLDPVLAADPANADARVLAEQARACTSGPAAGATAGATAAPPVGSLTPSACAGPVARLVPPEQGGLELAGPCESPRDYATRLQTMRSRYDEAATALSTGAYAHAITLLEAIARDAGDRYRDAAALLGDAKRKDSAARIYATAQDSEKRGDLDRAQIEFRRAHDLNPSLNIQADLTRIAAQRSSTGAKACEDANAAFAYGRTAEALRHYELVVKALPADDACVATARERFPQLRKQE